MMYLGNIYRNLANLGKGYPKSDRSVSTPFDFLQGKAVGRVRPYCSNNDHAVVYPETNTPYPRPYTQPHDD